jgi:hypothetical protein
MSEQLAVPLADWGDSAPIGLPRLVLSRIGTMCLVELQSYDMIAPS